MLDTGNVKEKTAATEGKGKSTFSPCFLLPAWTRTSWTMKHESMHGNKMTTRTPKCLKELLSKWIHISLVKCAHMYFASESIALFHWAMWKHLQSIQKHTYSDQARDEQLHRRIHTWESLYCSPFYFFCTWLPHTNDNSSLAITIRCSKLVVIWQRLTMSIRCRYRWISTSWFERMCERKIFMHAGRK